MYFTVVTHKTVYRVKAKSAAHLTQTLKSLGMQYLAIEANQD
jgi:hypothetical protein